MRRTGKMASHSKVSRGQEWRRNALPQNRRREPRRLLTHGAPRSAAQRPCGTLQLSWVAGSCSPLWFVELTPGAGGTLPGDGILRWATVLPNPLVANRDLYRNSMKTAKPGKSAATTPEITSEITSEPPSALTLPETAAQRARRPLTIKEFAEAIGVSPTTVSRSLSRRGRISEETREMVLERMKELGYTPNLHAQRLVSGRAYTVAICIGGGLAPTPNPFLVGLIRGLQQALEESNYGLLILKPDHVLKRWVDSRAVDGVIVVGGTQENAEQVAAMVSPVVPSIFVGTVPLTAAPNVGSIVIDTAGSGIKVAQLFHKYGHRRMGFIGSSHSQVVLPVYQRELQRLGVPLRDEYVVIAGDTPDDGERAMTQLLKLEHPPTAVFTRTDELAIGALRAARKNQVPVPQRLSIIGHDDVDFARFAEPPLTSVRIDCDTVGAAVVSLMFDQLANPDIAFEPRSVPTDIVMRETVATLTPSD